MFGFQLADTEMGEHKKYNNFFWDNEELGEKLSLSIESHITVHYCIREKLHNNFVIH